MAEPIDDSPLERAAGAAGSHATDAFALLANETRLAILLALWEFHEPGEKDDSVSFSDLYDRIDYNNPGNFSYHLEQLQGQFIRKRADNGGYELNTSGLETVRTVIAGAGVQDASLDLTEIDRMCPLCDSPTAVGYEEGTIYQICTDCNGIASREGLPDGYLNGMKFDPAGLTDRSADELMAAAEIAAYQHMQSMFEGLCDSCSGPVDASLRICENHESDGVCSNCRRVPAYTAQFQCRVCKDFHGTTPEVVSSFHPAVIAFFYEHGMSPRWHAQEFDDLSQGDDKNPEYETTLLSKDPPQIDVSISLDNDELRMTFDETVSIVEVNW